MTGAKGTVEPGPNEPEARRSTGITLIHLKSSSDVPICAGRRCLKLDAGMNPLASFQCHWNVLPCGLGYPQVVDLRSISRLRIFICTDGRSVINSESIKTVTTADWSCAKNVSSLPLNEGPVSRIPSCRSDPELPRRWYSTRSGRPEAGSLRRRAQ